MVEKKVARASEKILKVELYGRLRETLASSEEGCWNNAKLVVKRDGSGGIEKTVLVYGSAGQILLKFNIIPSQIQYEDDDDDG
jgi:hypothetical protein